MQNRAPPFQASFFSQTPGPAGILPEGSCSPENIPSGSGLVLTHLFIPPIKHHEAIIFFDLIHCHCYDHRMREGSRAGNTGC